MNFKIDFPENLTCPKGMYLPEREDVLQAVSLMKIVVSYIDPGVFEDDDIFQVVVSDELSFTSDGRLVGCCDTGEGLVLYPDHNPWTIESVFELMLRAVFGSQSVSMPIINLQETAAALKTLVNFVWALPDKMPDGPARTLIKDFCGGHDDIVYTSISVSSKYGD